MNIFQMFHKIQLHIPNLLWAETYTGCNLKKKKLLKLSFSLHNAIQVVPVNVSCTRSEFTILIPQQSLPPLDRESIYLGNPTCAAQLTATSYKILAQFVNCGTAGQVSAKSHFHYCLFDARNHL